MGIAVFVAILNLTSTSELDFAILSLLGAIAILSGIYLGLWWFSKGKWIGFGDVKLGLVLALLLGDYQLAFVALLAANLIGCIIVAIGFSTKKLTRKSLVPFGPLLIMGAVIANLFGPGIIQWYLGLII